MESHRHQLAAIMFTDIVGYTSLMGRDERKGLELLQRNREIHKPLIAQNNGEWIKEMGDGMLAKFDSAYDAVKCAIEIQEASRKDFKGQVRIGLHLGDIILEDGDIFGDGVNIASRIESIADPGGIYMSEFFQKAIQNHPDIRTRYLAEVALKNVDQSVKIHCVTGDAIREPSARKIKQLKSGLKHEEKLTKRFFRNPIFYLLLTVFMIALVTNQFWFDVSGTRTVEAIAVLPFTNMTGSEEEQYFVDIMHDAVITEISKIGGLIVKSRTSTLQFRNTTLEMSEIARILNVDAIVESSVYKTGDSVFVNVQLINARPKEFHIWADYFIRDTKHILSFYGELAKVILAEINVPVTSKEEELLTHTQEVNPEAYRAYLKGQFHMYKLSKESIDSAEYYYNISLKLDPNYALAYAGLSSIALLKAQNGLVPFYESSVTNIKFLEKALELDSTQSEIHFLEASFNTWGMWDFEEANRNFKKAIELNPNFALLRVYYAHLLCYYQNYDEAIIQGKYALRLDPLNNLVKGIYGMTLNNCRAYDQADSIFSVVLNSEQNDAISLSNLKTTYHMQKRFAEAYELWLTDYRNDPPAIEALESGYKIGGYTQALENLADLMVERSKTRFVTPWRICTLYTRAGMRVKALDYLEKAYDVHDQNMPYIISDPIFDFMRNDPRFEVIVKKMNFPEV